MSQLIQALSAILPAKPVITDGLRRLAYGREARFYRLTPEGVAVVGCEEEVQAATDGVRALRGQGFGSCGIGLTAETGRPCHSMACRPEECSREEAMRLC